VGVQQVTELIAEIAVASKEQSAGVEEINKAIMQMESVTQQNAALVEQVGAATLSFEEEAKRLTEAASRFKHGSLEPPAQTAGATRTRLPLASSLPQPATIAVLPEHTSDRKA
jgi:methyl-accepting chemotaxis protein